MQWKKARYTILHLLFVTVIAALGFVTLLSDSQWWRATLTTVTLCLVLNALIGCAVHRGVKQAFAAGFAISSFFYLISLYTLLGVETLPFLITQHVQAYLQSHATHPFSEEHFAIVAVQMWGLSCAYSGGLLGRRWYSLRHANVA